MGKLLRTRHYGLSQRSGLDRGQDANLMGVFCGGFRASALGNSGKVKFAELIIRQVNAAEMA